METAAAAAPAPARERKRQRQSEGGAVPSMTAVGGGEAQYVYLPIADALKASGVRVCIFAAVSEIGAAFHSRGTDFTRTLRIFDQSRSTGISVTFFANDTALLPCVRSCGDVISLHNVKITNYHGEFFVTCEKKSSSFALFEGKASTESSPYQTSMKYHGSKQDDEILTNMRMWLVYPPPEGVGMKDLELQLRSVQSDLTFDLVCKVLHVYEAPGGEWIFYVWDGTDIPTTELQTFLNTEAVPLHLEEVPLPREVLCTLPCIGTILRIFSNKFCKEIRHLQRDIYWARFCNITCKQEFGIWKGTLPPSSRVRLLSNEDGSVVERLKMYESRLSTKVGRRPMASLHKDFDFTDVEFKRAGYATLMESLTYERVTHKLKTLVRVVSAFPCQGSDLHSLLTSNKYCLRLTLEDPTARIHAYVCKDGLVRFFGGSLTAAALTRKMNRLLGVPEQAAEEGTPVARNPPWIWCCLKSYLLEKEDPWGSRRYQVFGTEVRD